MGRSGGTGGVPPGIAGEASRPGSLAPVVPDTGIIWPLTWTDSTLPSF